MHVLLDVLWISALEFLPFVVCVSQLLILSCSSFISSFITSTIFYLEVNPILTVWPDFASLLYIVFWLILRVNILEWDTQFRSPWASQGYLFRFESLLSRSAYPSYIPSNQPRLSFPTNFSLCSLRLEALRTRRVVVGRPLSMLECIYCRVLMRALMSRGWLHIKRTISVIFSDNLFVPCNAVLWFSL